MRKSEKAFEVLEKHAESVLKPRKKRRNPIPIVVEFAGSPKAGKTTNIEIVAHFFKRIGFKVWAPTEGASKRTPYHLRRDLVAFNAWSLNYAISELLLAYHNVERNDLIILDRGPFDSLAWMGLLRDQGNLTCDHYDVIKQYALHPKWTCYISKVFLFTCKPEISMEREHQSKLIRRPGTAMNDEMLSGLLGQYQMLKKELASYPLEHIDTSPEGQPLDTAYKIAQQITRLLANK